MQVYFEVMVYLFILAHVAEAVYAYVVSRRFMADEALLWAWQV
jgi:hypothetical protein